MRTSWSSSLPSALAVAGFVALSCGCVGQAQAQAKPGCAALVITGHPFYPPVAWAEQEEIVGAAPTLVRGIATDLGVANVVSKDFGSWEGAQSAARDGKADVIFGIYKNDARSVYLDYIEPPFMMDPTSIVVRKGAGFPFAEWSDLAGRKGVTNSGESFGDEFDAFMAKKLTVARADGVDEAFAALLAKQADYLIIGLYPGRDESRKLGVTDKIEFLPKELVSAEMYVAFSKQSKCGALKSGISAGIRSAVEDGAMQRYLEAAHESIGN